MMTDTMLQPFASATREVCKTMLDMDAVVGPPAFAQSVRLRDDGVAVMVGFTGDYSGEAYYIFPENMALEMVKNLSGMEIDAVDDFVTSAMGEISNIISGNAATGLSEQAIVCDILPPRILEADTLRPAQGVQLINAGIDTPVGRMELVVRLSA